MLWFYLCHLQFESKAIIELSSSILQKQANTGRSERCNDSHGGSVHARCFLFEFFSYRLWLLSGAFCFRGYPWTGEEGLRHFTDWWCFSYQNFVLIFKFLFYVLCSMSSDVLLRVLSQAMH